MGVFTHWPYTNFHELNLDWLLKVCKDLDISLSDLSALVNKEIANLDERIKILDDKIEHSELPEVVREELRALIESGEMGELIEQALLNINDEIELHTPDNGTSESPTGVSLWIKTKDGAIINDFGVHTDRLVADLKANSTNKIYAIIISHYHEDHVGDIDQDGTPEGFLNFLNDTFFDFSECKAYLPHGELVWSNFLPSSADFQVIQNRETIIETALTEKGIEIIHPEEDDVVKIGSVDVKFNNLSTSYFAEYYPCFINYLNENVGYTQYNNFSMITTFKHISTIIYPGDIQKEAEKNNYKVFNNCNVIFMPHHGLNRPIDMSYLNSVSGDIAIIPTGYQYYDPTGMVKVDTQKLVQQGAIPMYSVDAGKIKITDSIYGMEWNVTGDIILDTDYAVSQDYGYILYQNDNLNNMNTPGSWNTQNSEIASGVVNTPFTNGGYHGETIRAKATKGLIQRAALSWNRYQTKAVRSYEPDLATWSDWKYLSHLSDPAVKSYANIVPNTWIEQSGALEIDNIINSSYFKRTAAPSTDGARQNYLTYFNNMLAIGLDITTTEAAPSGTRIMTWQGVNRIGCNFMLYDPATKTPYLARVSYSGSDRYIALAEAVPANTRLIGFVSLPALP